ncbi:MAG TPA: hypothetical protein VGF86_02275 [Candidatus Tumulicola sp.]|jgi:hypothetical protein
MKTVRLTWRVVALSLVAGLPLPALAHGAPVVVAVAAAHPHVTMPHPISVNACNPQRNNRMSAGYAPGYWPGGSYWGWPSVYGYGYNYYSYPVEGNPTLGIDYSNATSVVMHDIEFGLIARGQLVAEVRDVGTFSPGAEIKHEFGLNPNVFPLSTSMVQCVPLKITFADGTKWKNPHLPALHKSIYGKPHY